MADQLHFGFWTVLDPTPIARRVLCRCACGVERRVFAPDLKRGKSNGCRDCFGARLAVKVQEQRRTKRGRFASDTQWIRDADGRVVRRAA